MPRALEAHEKTLLESFLNFLDKTKHGVVLWEDEEGCGAFTLGREDWTELLRKFAESRRAKANTGPVRAPYRR